jgi:hypothetical protein
MADAKPIAIIYYSPYLFGDGKGEVVDIAKMNSLMIEKFPDYHVLAIPSNLSHDGSCEDVRLEVFHPKDFTSLEFIEMEKLLKQAIEEIKANSKN